MQPSAAVILSLVQQQQLRQGQQQQVLQVMARQL
jgi:hypothetical protein